MCQDYYNLHAAFSGNKAASKSPVIDGLMGTIVCASKPYFIFQVIYDDNFRGLYKPKIVRMAATPSQPHRDLSNKGFR